MKRLLVALAIAMPVLLFSQGNVGIGTTTPESRLHVLGSLRFETGQHGFGKVLFSDSSGSADWRFLPFRVFNVKDYGAIGDGVNDDRVSIQNTINAAYQSGGGKVYFPNGVYYLGAGTGERGAQLIIPYSSFASSVSNPTIEFIGETHTPQNYNPLQAPGSNRQPSLKGVIIQSGLPVSDTGSIISSLGQGGGVWNLMNFTKVKLQNIVFRLNARNEIGAASGAKDTAINFFNLSMIEIKNVTVDVNCPNDSIVLPLGSSVGVLTPSNSNWVKNDMDDFWVIGVYKAIIAYEHANFDNTYIDGCYYGLVMPNTNHSVHGNRMGFWRTKRAIKIEVSNPYSPGITIDQYNNERYMSTNRWFYFECDLEEQAPGQVWGHITYNTVSGPFDFIKINPSGSRIFTTGGGGNGYRWSARPNFADTATFGLNTTLGHMEFKPYGSSSTNWNILLHEGQSRNIWNTGKVGVGGNPFSSTYKLSVFDSSGGAPNILLMHSASNTNVLMSSSGVNTQMAYRFQRSGTTKWQFGVNFDNDGADDFYLYNQQTGTATLYSNGGHTYLGGHAFNNPGITILDNRRVGIGTTAPDASAKLDITSTTQGFLPPRMTAAQAGAIASPAEGLMVYVTDTGGVFNQKGWWGFNGITWDRFN